MNNIIKRKWNQNSMVIIEDLQGMAFQAESGGHTFQISGIDGEGNTVALSGTPAGVMLRADGQDVTLTCSVSGGVVSATLPANAYSVPGRFGLTIFLTSDGQKTAIYAAVGTVGKTSSGTVAPPAGSDVVDLVNAINTAISGIPATDTALKAAMAPTYSNSALYAVGEYAWYNGTLYRCTTAITTAETWTSGHWTAAAIGTDSANGLRDLKSAFDSNIGTTAIPMQGTNQYIKTNYAIGGGPVSYTPAPSSGFKYAVVNCQAGDVFTINGTGGNSPRLWCFVGSDDKVVDVDATVNDSQTNLVLIAPTGSAKLIINDNSDRTSYVGQNRIDKLEQEMSTAEVQIDEMANELINTPLSLTLNYGYVKADGSLNTTSTGYRYSDLISVQPGEQYYIDTYGSTGVLTIAYYASGASTADTTKSMLGSGSRQQTVVTIPDGVATMRITCDSAQLSYLANCYKVPEITRIKNDVDTLKTKVSENVSYELVKRKATVSFIFDDGNAKDADIKAIFDSKGKKCGFAIYSSASRYIDYHNEGYEILAHATGHIYTTNTEQEVRAILSTALATVKNLVGECYGFVTPSSVMPDIYQPLVYDYYQYGYTIYKGEESVPANACMGKTIKSYQMWRSGLEGLTVAQIKSILDYAVANNLLVCIYGHATYLDTEGYWSADDLEEILDYCDTIGIQVETPYKSTLKFLSFRHNEDT